MLSDGQCYEILQARKSSEMSLNFVWKVRTSGEKNFIVPGVPFYGTGETNSHGTLIAGKTKPRTARGLNCGNPGVSLGSEMKEFSTRFTRPTILVCPPRSFVSSFSF